MRRQNLSTVRRVRVPQEAVEPSGMYVHSLLQGVSRRGTYEAIRHLCVSPHTAQYASIMVNTGVVVIEMKNCPLAPACGLNVSRRRGPRIRCYEPWSHKPLPNARKASPSWLSALVSMCTVVRSIEFRIPLQLVAPRMASSPSRGKGRHATLVG